MPIELNLGRPNAKQDKALRDTHKYLAFGGSRGGGKSWFVRAKSVILCSRYKGYKCMIIRRTYPELIANHVKPLKDALKIGSKGCPATYNSAEKEFRFKNGSSIILRYVGDGNSVDRLQGTEVDSVFIDEATQLDEETIKKIAACVRGVNDFPHHVYLTCNPGGIGHGFIKRLYVDRTFEANENPDDYIFIQSNVYDNVALLESDPSYLRNLEALPEKLRLAWLDGRWDVFQGSYFSEFRPTPDALECSRHDISVEDALREHRWTHVIKPFKIPSDWTIYRGYDWGYGKPASLLWAAIDHEETIYVIVEDYMATATPNEGIHWTNKQQADECQRVEHEHPLLAGKSISGWADPSIWDGSHDTYGVSAAEEFEKHGIWFEPGNNARIAGWMQIRERLKFDEEGFAKLYIFDTCPQLIRCFPLMMFDEHKVEDLDTSLEDHCLDSCRYICMGNVIAPREIIDDRKPMHDPLNQFETETKYKRYNALK